MTAEDLFEISLSRYKEAKALFDAEFYAGSIYLCGYAIELLLKRHIVKSLNWDTYPPSLKGKNNTFFTHELGDLLILSGLDSKILDGSDLEADWRTASAWKAEMRYTKSSDVTREEAEGAIESSKRILNFINGLTK